MNEQTKEQAIKYMESHKIDMAEMLLTDKGSLFVYDVMADFALSLSEPVSEIRPPKYYRNWEEDYPQENGMYQNRCRDCKELFFGHKHRKWCKVCHNKTHNNLQAGLSDEEITQWAGRDLPQLPPDPSDCLAENAIELERIEAIFYSRIEGAKWYRNTYSQKPQLTDIDEDKMVEVIIKRLNESFNDYWNSTSEIIKRSAAEDILEDIINFIQVPQLTEIKILENLNADSLRYIKNTLQETLQRGENVPKTQLPSILDALNKAISNHDRVNKPQLTDTECKCLEKAEHEASGPVKSYECTCKPNIKLEDLNSEMIDKLETLKILNKSQLTEEVNMVEFRQLLQDIQYRIEGNNGMENNELKDLWNNISNAISNVEKQFIKPQLTEAKVLEIFSRWTDTVHLSDGNDISFIGEEIYEDIAKEITQQGQETEEQQ